MLPFVSYKVKLIAEKFFTNSDLDASGISLRAFDCKTNLRMCNNLANPKLVQKVIINLDLSNMVSF